MHHINHVGEDAGVVYCEMQGSENSGESRIHLNIQRSMYPGKCGYSSRTGGIMKNLRETTTNKKVHYYFRYFKLLAIELFPIYFCNIPGSFDI